MPNRRIRIMIALALFILIILPLLSNGIDLIVDWLWFKQEGFRLIYWTILTTQIQLERVGGCRFHGLDGDKPGGRPLAFAPARLPGGG